MDTDPIVDIEIWEDIWYLYPMSSLEARTLARLARDGDPDAYIAGVCDLVASHLGISPELVESVPWGYLRQKVLEWWAVSWGYNEAT